MTIVRGLRIISSNAQTGTTWWNWTHKTSSPIGWKHKRQPHPFYTQLRLAIIPVMVITLKPSKAVMAKWKYSFQEIAAVVLRHKIWGFTQSGLQGPFSWSRIQFIHSYFNLPPDIGFTLFTPIKGRIDSLTVYIYKVETCTNILRYNTCMSSYPGDRKCTKIEP
jgi:hypothetical protein